MAKTQDPRDMLTMVELLTTDSENLGELCRCAELENGSTLLYHPLPRTPASAVSGGDVTVEAAVMQLRHYLAQLAEAGRVLRARKSQEVS